MAARGPSSSAPLLAAPGRCGRCAASDAPAAPTGISTMNAIGIGIGVMLIILNTLVT